MEYVWHAYVNDVRYPVVYKDFITPSEIASGCIYHEQIEDGYEEWTRDFLASLNEARGVLIIDDGWRAVSFNRIRPISSETHIRFEILESLGEVNREVRQRNNPSDSKPLSRGKKLRKSAALQPEVRHAPAPAVESGSRSIDIAARAADAFLTGPALTAAIKEILAERGARAAAAFWGRGFNDWIGGDHIRVIANLATGGADPHSLQQVRAEIRRSDRLNANVYIGSKMAVVASSNGLTPEGGESPELIEAGLSTTEIGPISAWFETLWEEATSISGKG